VEYLNTLFGERIQGVNQHQGIANKFLGDGFMAVFGAPRNDSGQAVQQQLDAAQYPAEDLGDVELKGQAKPARLFRLA